MYVSQSCLSLYVCNVWTGINRNSDLVFSHFCSCSQLETVREFFSGKKGSMLALQMNYNFNKSSHCKSSQFTGELKERWNKAKFQSEMSRTDLC